MSWLCKIKVYHVLLLIAILAAWSTGCSDFESRRDFTVEEIGRRPHATPEREELLRFLRSATRRSLARPIVVDAFMRHSPERGLSFVLTQWIQDRPTPDAIVLMDGAGSHIITLPISDEDLAINESDSKRAVIFDARILVRREGGPRLWSVMEEVVAVERVHLALSTKGTVISDPVPVRLSLE